MLLGSEYETKLVYAEAFHTMAIDLTPKVKHWRRKNEQNCAKISDVALVILAYLVARIEGVVHEASDDRSLSYCLVSQKYELVLVQRSHRCVTQSWSQCGVSGHLTLQYCLSNAFLVSR